MVTPAARPEAAAHLSKQNEISHRRACNVIGADRSAVRYRSRRPDDAPIRARLREWRRSAGASATAASRYCFAGKACT